MKILLVAFWEKISIGEIWRFTSFFNVWLGVVKIEPGHCYYWISKQSGDEFFHDCYWIFKQTIDD